MPYALIDKSGFEKHQPPTFGKIYAYGYLTLAEAEDAAAARFGPRWYIHYKVVTEGQLDRREAARTFEEQTRWWWHPAEEDTNPWRPGFRW